MTERRYNDEEIESIFAKAAEGAPPSARQLSGAEGLTLADLQGIGREVGISAESVAMAARTIDARPMAASRTLLGLPIGVERTVALDRRLTDREWEHLVVELRETFNALGVVRTEGSLRQWTNGNLQAVLESTPDGERLRISTRNGNARARMTAGLATLGIGAATALAMSLEGKFLVSLSGTMLIGLMGVGMFAWGALRLPRWARLRARQMEGIAEGLAEKTEGEG